MVVGAGIVGGATALELARRGMSVGVFEAARPGWGATRHAAGMLAPIGESENPGPFLEFALASRSAWPRWADALRSASGVDIGFLHGGRLELARTPAEEDRLREREVWVRTLDPGSGWLDAARTRERVPAVTPEVRGALFIPLDAQVDNRLVARALPRALRREGVRLRTGTPVSGLLTSGGRVAGVRLQRGEEVRAGAVILATGVRAGELAPRPELHPPLPVRGQMLSFRPSGRTGALPPTLLEGEGVYLVPRRGGEILVGATVERVGFRPWVTAAGIGALARGARSLLPFLSGLPPIEVWAGLRPGSMDGLPVIGPDPDLPGLVHAHGLYRNGILLAPATASVVASLVHGEDPGGSWSPFRPDRPGRKGHNPPSAA